VPAVVEYIERQQPQVVAVTGGGAMRLCAGLGRAQAHLVPEFEAWALGAPILARRAGIELPERYLLVSMGTGTSIHGVCGGRSERAGGSALGGGTLLGLGRLLLPVDSFADVVALAARGDRAAVDLLVGDIYTHGEPPIPPHINAASFGKLASRRPEDLAHALMGLVGENLGVICGTLARSHRTDTILYCGSTLDENQPLQDILTTVSWMYGVSAIFLPQGAYCGAVGAAAHATMSAPAP
jgi:type II pantothenate kinase